MAIQGIKLDRSQSSTSSVHKVGYGARSSSKVDVWKTKVLDGHVRGTAGQTGGKFSILWTLLSDQSVMDAVEMHDLLPIDPNWVSLVRLVTRLS